MDDDLEARLQSHSEAFEGLLSLIPAKEYYAKDTSNQWQAKKQTKEQKKAARKAKLDPANIKTAKDVMDENERKRKRELDMDDDQENEPESSSTVAKPKRQKIEKLDDNAKKQEKVEKRRMKRERTKEKQEKLRAKAEAKRAKKDEADLRELDMQQQEDDNDEPDNSDESEDEQDLVHGLNIEGLTGSAPVTTASSSTRTTPNIDSPTFDISENHSASSSSSSIVPPATKDDNTSLIGTTNKKKDRKSTKEHQTNMAITDHAHLKPSQEDLQARLKARIELLRAKRKADGPNGQPAQTRQDLLEARRKKEQARKAHKKEQWLKAKQEEDRLNNERLRGSGSPLTTDLFSPRPQKVETNFSFGRVAFEDGVTADASLTSLVDHSHKKGPQDVKTALEQAEKKTRRLNGLDETKRRDIEDKDLWLNAKKRAHGERVRDDQSLLKKTLKRKEKAKAKSGKEWNERIDGVKKGQEMRQRKREDNLAKRKEEKGTKKSGSKAKSGAGKKGGKPKSRPGF